MSKKKKKTEEDKKKEKLKWILAEYDCFDLEQAKEEAKADTTLNRLLREYVVVFD